MPLARLFCDLDRLANAPSCTMKTNPRRKKKQKKKKQKQKKNKKQIEEEEEEEEEEICMAVLQLDDMHWFIWCTYVTFGGQMSMVLQH